MKITLNFSGILLAGFALLISASYAQARAYGVSSSSAGRGTVYHTNRGGAAYVGPNGAAARGANGRAGVVTNNGAAYVGPNGAAVSVRYCASAVGVNGSVVVNRPPVNYIRTVPYGYRSVYYGGYNCYYYGGIYYRPVMYQGTTVYIVVN